MATIQTHPIVLKSKDKLTQKETSLEISYSGVNIKSFYNNISNTIGFSSKGIWGNVDFSLDTGFNDNSFVQKKYTDLQNSYSTTEIKTGGTWIDGKPIYTITKLTADPIPADMETQFPNIIVGSYTVYKYTKTT